MRDTIPMLIALCGLLIMPAARAADEKWVKLVHVDTSKVLSIADNADDGGAHAVLAKDENSKSQQWNLVKDGDHYKIVNHKSGKVLDVEMDSRDEGGNIIQWDEKTEDNDNQRWSWQGDEKDKERRLKAKSSGMVLDAGDENAVVQKKADDKAKSQLWRVEEVKE
jgi:hypothetical protein